MEIVEVEWVDSQAFDGWHNPGEMKAWEDSLTCHTVGYLLREDDERIVLVMSKSSVALSNGMAIPRVAIIDMTYLRDTKTQSRSENDE